MAQHGEFGEDERRRARGASARSGRSARAGAGSDPSGAERRVAAHQARPAGAQGSAHGAHGSRAAAQAPSPARDANRARLSASDASERASRPAQGSAVRTGARPAGAQMNNPRNRQRVASDPSRAAGPAQAGASRSANHLDPARAPRSAAQPAVGARQQAGRGSARPAAPAAAAGAVRPVKTGRDGSRGLAAGAPAAAGAMSGRRGKGPWRVVFWLALVVLAGSLGALGYIGYTYWNGQQAYDSLATDYFEAPSDPAAATLADFEINWDALREANPDVVGWVYVPDTKISYPIVHRDGDDSHYLNHTFNGDTTGRFGAEFGCIMLSGENAGDFTDQVNVIYGHNMADGSMFAQFAQFTDAATFNAHRTVYILTPTGNYKLSTFAIDRIEETDTTVVVPNFASAAELSGYAQTRMDASLVTPNPASSPASSINQVFAFSTCDNSNDFYRFITFAEVVDYQPVGASGSGSSVNPEDAASVDASVGERVA